ncbi:Na+/H+ antiporter subunit E [Millisia brevis]|uniref:Na+/H+ antiporter subunit E n=1 Tax=Millisia brevis TaxID=264148 RepID=UPI00082C3846|nr:Na+/H+ antiporter subunit E [Millisia brevis]
MTWVTWPMRLAAFGFWYIGAVVVANVAILHDNLTPGQDSIPGIARVPTRCRTDAEVTLLAALITLTPGTLTLGVRTVGETRVLYVHGMYSDGPDGLRGEVDDMEGRMLRAIRRTGVGE